jgi:hypothetical protein
MLQLMPSMKQAVNLLHHPGAGAFERCEKSYGGEKSVKRAEREV